MYGVTHLVKESLYFWPRQQARTILHGGSNKVGRQDDKRQLISALFAFDLHPLEILHARHAQ